MTTSEAPLSRLARGLMPSPTLAVEATAQKMREAGIQVLSLGAGQPDFDTPEPIKEAAIAAIRKGVTKYTAVGGTLELLPRAPRGTLVRCRW